MPLVLKPPAGSTFDKLIPGAEPTTQAEVIAINQQHQRNKRAENRQIDNGVPIDRKAPIVQCERVEKPFPPSCDGKEVHQGQGAVGKISKYPDCRQHADSNLYGTDPVDLSQADIDFVDVARQALVLGWRDDLVRCPKEDEPDQPGS